MTGFLLIDSDAFLILAGSNPSLLDRAADTLGFGIGVVRCLPALPHMLRKGRSLRRYPTEMKKRAMQCCARVGKLLDRPQDDGQFQRLVDVSEIHEGEALLYALLAENPESILLSGDKRAMRALGTASDLDGIRRVVQGRMVCLEQALRLLVVRYGVHDVGEALKSIREIDTMLRVTFSDARLTDQNECLRSLQSYIDHLVDELPQGLLLDEGGTR